MEIAFYLAGLIAVAATIRVITHTNPVHALLYLIVSLLAISAVFFSLGAYFAAALEIIVYAGAIMVLFVFVVMMLNLGNVQQQERDWMKPTVDRARPVVAGAAGGIDRRDPQRIRPGCQRRDGRREGGGHQPVRALRTGG